MIKIVMAQIDTSVGDFQDNRNRIHLGLMFAQSHGADMIIFPEGATTGYPQKDLLYSDAFIDKNVEIQKEIRQQSTEFKDLTIVLGCVRRSTDLDTHKGIYNSAVVIRNGQFQGFYDKQLLPNYNVFDERRYFLVGNNAPIFNIGEHLFGITICEDVWDDEYDLKPIQRYEQKVDFVINLSASPFDPEKIKKRKEVLKKRNLESGLPIIYVNQIGGQDGLIFDGASMIANGGEVLLVGREFKEDFILVNFDKGKISPLFEPVEELETIDKIHLALVLGIKDYFKKTRFKKAVLGLSGGIDSAVTAALAVEALGPDNVLGVLMPSQYSSGGSVTDALLLADNLKIKTNTISIKGMMEAYEKDLLTILSHNRDYITRKYQSDVTEQNLQARIRGNILMALSNDENRLLLSTGNKSEMSCGYCTLYGDMAGGLSVIADVYKTTVYRLARRLPAIPLNSIEKPPSAELKPDQKDTDSLPPYDVLDGILKQYIERKKSAQEIVAKGFDLETVKKVVQMVDRNEYKRRQAAPGLIMSERDLVIGRRMPIANRFNQFDK
jgi:NAD+ synthase (glutamine-hydrolysing)